MKKASIVIAVLLLFLCFCGVASAENVAKGKWAEQSSTDYNAPPTRAVDGNTDGKFWNGSVSHTKFEHTPWWQVDLGASYYINSVIISNRTDCCGERLSDYYVFVSDSPFTTNDVNALAGQSNVGKFYISGPNGLQNQLSINRSGRYVRIQLTGDNYLHIAEVEVLTSGVSTSSASINATVSPGTLDITVKYSGAPGNAKDWIGFYKVGSADNGYISYQYLNGNKSGSLAFKAPEPGAYNFRMFENDGYKLLATSNNLVAAYSASLTAKLDASGENITVTYSMGPGNAKDWIGIYKVGAADNGYISYQYLNGNKNGSLTFKAPAVSNVPQVGTYNFRMFVNDGYTLLATSNEIVIGQSTYNLTATLSGGNITVTYSGAPGNARDWIGIYKVGAADNGYISYQYLNGKKSGSLNFTAPTTAGSYNFRMFVNDGYTLLATSNEVVIGQQTSEQNLKAAPGDGKVYLSWNKDTNTSVIGYHLFRGTSSGGETSTPVTDFAIKETSYADPNVSNGIKYCYIMKPVYSGEKLGGASNEACATPTPNSGGSSGGSGSGTGTGTGTGTDNPVAKGTKIVLLINNPYMTVNDVSKEIDPGRGTVPLILKGRTLLPIRSIVEAIGGEIKWNESERKVTILVGATTIEMWIDSTNTRVNGSNRTTDVAPAIINGRTMLPLRFVAENLGANVNWDSVNYKITLLF